MSHHLFRGTDTGQMRIQSVAVRRPLKHVHCALGFFVLGTCDAHVLSMAGSINQLSPLHTDVTVTQENWRTRTHLKTGARLRVAASALCPLLPPRLFASPSSFVSWSSQFDAHARFNWAQHVVKKRLAMTVKIL